MIGCHLLLIVGGGGSICLIEPSVISMKGVFPPAVPGLAPGLLAAGYQCYCSRVRRGERCGHQPSTSLYPVYPGYPALLSGASAVPVSHGGSRPGWDEDGATLHPVHTHWHTLALAVVTVSPQHSGQLSIGRGQCIVMRHPQPGHQPRGIAAAING